MRAATVVITSYNSEAVIRRSVGAVLAQTVPCDIVLADDGSTDATVWRAVRMADDRLTVLHLPHSGGPSAGRNAGIAMAATPFVAVLDADDRIAPEKIERQIAELERTGSAWCLCDALVEGWDDANEGQPLIARGRAGWVGEALAQYNFIPTAVPLLRTDLARRARFVDTPVTGSGATTEDWNYWKDVAVLEPAAYVPETLATYSWSEGGRSGRLGRSGAHFHRRAR